MSVIEEIAAERKRQVEVEGWSEAHDDAEEREGQLAGAAACYAFGSHLWTGEPNGVGILRNAATVWPWAEHYWKPRDRRRDLIKAAALIVAEIERLDRASPRGQFLAAQARIAEKIAAETAGRPRRPPPPRPRARPNGSAA